MNRPLVLLYNLNHPKGEKIRRMCLGIGLRTRLVAPEEYGQPLGVLAEGTAPQHPWEVLEVPLCNEGRTFRLAFSNEAGGRFTLTGGVELAFETWRRVE